jgi:SAM-dependent methyltransferase
MPVSERLAPAEAGAGVEFLSAPRDSEFPDEWYALSGADHFWFRWRLAATLRLAGDLAIPLREPLRCLEIGSGAGILRDQLEAATRWNVDISDLNQAALRRARPGRGRVLYYDVCEESLGAVYDVVLAFDVIEHLASTRAFLSSAVRHVKPGGHLLLNVPALQHLYSAYDQNVGHHRRYDRRSLAREIDGLDLDAPELRYWGLSLVPLLALRKALLGIRRRAPSEVIRRGFRPPGSLANALLSGLSRVELAIVGGRPPLGTSVLLAARRRSP